MRGEIDKAYSARGGAGYEYEERRQMNELIC